MDHRRQRQLVNQMLEANAKSEEELKNMTPEERHEYLQGRLKQKMFFSTAQRQSMYQKQQLSEKIQEKIQDNKPEDKKEETNAKKERNRRKRQKKREKLRAQKDNGEGDVEEDDDVVIVKDPNEEGSESDYHSD